jgi:hypothetical protein
MALLIMKFPAPFPSLHSSPVQIFSSALFSNSLSLYSSLSIKDKVSHPYRTTGNIVVLYKVIYIFYILNVFVHCNFRHGSLRKQNRYFLCDGPMFFVTCKPKDAKNCQSQPYCTNVY